MFFSSAPPVVEFVDYKRNHLVFLAKKPLRLAKDNSVKITLGADKGKNVKVYVQQYRAVENGKLAYVAIVEDECSFQPPTPAGDLAALRNGQRLDCHLRVMSPDLPGYSGVSLDLSSTGLQLETHSAVPVGKVVRLRLETHISEMEWIEVRARVAWSRQDGRKTYRCGLQFQDVTPELRAQLDELERYLVARENANMTQLVLQCADRYLLGYGPLEEKPAAETAAV
jgi:hypothetical protein